MKRSLALSSVWFAAPTCTFQVVACRAHLHHPGRLSSSFACSACQSSVTDRWSLGGFWKGLVFGLWLPSTNELCHAVCLHISVFCLGSVSALLCMMTSLGNSLPASGPLALLTHLLLSLHMAAAVSAFEQDNRQLMSNAFWEDFGRGWSLDYAPKHQ